MSTPADRLIRAFIDVLGADDNHVTFRRRGGSPGYLHLIPSGFDPMRPQDRYLAIELHNGTVCVTEEFKETLGAQPRPASPIGTDALGHSAGPNYGRFKWALPHQAIISRWGDEHAFARSVLECFEALRGTAAGVGERAGGVKS